MAQYEILRSLDRGGMAEVFLARLVGVGGFEKRVVLKRVLPHLSGDARFLGRFVDEARVAAQLSHPNIVQIFELGEQHGQYFIAMEYVDGRNLKDLVKRLYARGERLPVEHAVRVGSAVLDALHYAHTRTDDYGRLVGLVHRDVSPANVLVSFDGVVKLIDFGIARTAERVERTSPGTVVGKAGYMAPEQMRGEAVDARTDVFALSATLFHVITGVLPYPGAGAANVMQAVNTGQRRPYDEVRELVDEPLFALLAKGCAHHPGDRYASAGEMQAALERYAGGRGFAPGTMPLRELMRRTFAEGDDHDEDTLDAETQSRMVTLMGSAFTETSTREESPPDALPSTTAPAPAARRRQMGIVAVAAAGGMALFGAGLAWTLTAMVTEPAAEAATETATATETETATEAATEAEAEAEAAIEAEAEAATEAATDAGAAAATEAGTEEQPRGRSPRVAPRRKQRGAERRVQAAHASLTLDSEPWSEVRINGWKAGLTPLHAVELPAGRHDVHLVNPDAKLERRLTVTLRAGESRRMRVKLK